MSTRYGGEHQRLRARWRPRVERGEVACCLPYCGHVIVPGEAWDLAHDPMDPSRWLGPAHARCNRNTTLERRLRGRRPGGWRWRSPEWSA
jgi:hypothetical protein